MHVATLHFDEALVRRAARSLPSGYLVSLGGGAKWVLPGRYDPISQTGDAAFPAHKGNC